MALVTLRFRTLPTDVARFCKLLAGRNRLQAKLTKQAGRCAQANKKTHRGTPVQQPFPLNKGRRPKVSAGPSSKKHRTHGRRIDSFSVVQIRYSFLCLKKSQGSVSLRAYPCFCLGLSVCACRARVLPGVCVCV